MMPGLEQARGGYAKYTASHGAADVVSALVLNTTDHLDLLHAGYERWCYGRSSSLS